jgi:hypothetical protein
MKILTFKSLVGVTFSILILLYGVSHAYSEQMYSLLVKTVDHENRPINAETVSWWFVDNPDKKMTLHCKQSNCSEWLIRNKKPLEIIVYVFASKVRKNDPHCWDWFEGKAKNQIGQKELIITLLQSSTVCK